jgi:hypothetical protein
MIVMLDGWHAEPVVKNTEGIHLVSNPIVSTGIGLIHIVNVRISAVAGQKNKHRE